MKTRTIGLVAGMVLVAASAGFSQSAEMNKKDDMNATFSSNVVSEIPAILGSFDSTSCCIDSKCDIINDGYMEMNKDEMATVHGEVIIPWWYLIRIIFHPSPSPILL